MQQAGEEGRAALREEGETSKHDRRSQSLILSFIHTMTNNAASERETEGEREREEDAARFPSSGRHFTNIYSKEMPLPQSPQNGVGTEEMREMSKGGETGNEAFSRAHTPYAMVRTSREGFPSKKWALIL